VEAHKIRLSHTFTYHNVKPPNAYVSLIVYSLMKTLLKTGKPDDWGVTAVKKDKALNMCTGYNIGK